MPFLLNLDGKEIVEIFQRNYDLNNQKRDSRNGKNVLKLTYLYKEKLAILSLDKIEIISYRGEHAKEDALSHGLFVTRNLTHDLIAEMEIENEICVEDAYYGNYFMYPYPTIGFYISEKRKHRFYGRDLKGRKMLDILKIDFPKMPDQLAEEFSNSFKDLWKDRPVTWREYAEENDLECLPRMGDIIRKNMKKNRILEKQWKNHEDEILKYVFRECDKE